MKQIKPIKNNGSILLRFTVNEKRYVFTPIKGARYSNQLGLKKVEMIADQIMLDIELGVFDSTLSRYQSLPPIQEFPKNPVDLRELWIKYVNFKRSSLAESTLDIDLKRRVGNILDEMPEDPIQIRDWLIAHKSPLQTKKILTQLNACFNWAVDSGIVDNNPFAGMARKIRIPRKTDEDDINPFTVEERDKIIQAFKTSINYSHYCYLVSFLFYTGCRPSEAIALTWDDIRENTIIFNKVLVNQKIKNRLKTQKKRIIKINLQVHQLLEEIQDEQTKSQLSNPHKLVFPSKNGIFIDWHNFRNRAWKQILSTLLEIEYRNPYQTRHTFITLAIRKGVGYADIAKHCGNSPRIILERYAGVSRDFVMPPL